MKKNKTEKKFKLFDLNRDGKGVIEEEENRKPTLGFFFKLLFRKFSKLLQLNLLMLFLIVPILVFVYVYFAGYKTPTSTDVLYAPLMGMAQTGASLGYAPSLDLASIQMGIPLYTPGLVITLLLLVVFLAITFGWQNVGAAYVLRGLFRGDAVFVFSDYFYAIKKNFKQGFVLGLIDCLIMFVLGYDLVYFFNSEQTGFSNFIYAMTIALIILYIIFRFYTYLMIVTFNIKLSKAFKNALIFIVLGIKRNIMALLGLAILTALAVVPILLLMPLGLGVALVLPLIYYLGVGAFIYTYAAYPIIKKHMIDPVIVAPATDIEENE